MRFGHFRRNFGQLHGQARIGRREGQDQGEVSAIGPPRLCWVLGGWVMLGDWCRVFLVLGAGCRLALGAALALDAAAAFLLGAGFEARLLLLLLPGSNRAAACAQAGGA